MGTINENWHTMMMRIVKNRTDAELEGSKDDLIETIILQEEMAGEIPTPKLGQYHDELHYVGMEMKKRADKAAKEMAK